MQQKRTRKGRAPIERLSPTALHVMGDEVLYPELANFDSFAADFVYRHPTQDTDRCLAEWESVRDTVLKDWVARFPGTRPSYWWLFNAPRMSPETVEDNGWIGDYYVPLLCDPRIRLGGTGTPKYEALAYVPSFHCGIPDDWIDQVDMQLHAEHLRECGAVPIDPANPPTFESQANYLRRHGLFLPGEEKRLSPADFEAETVEA